MNLSLSLDLGLDPSIDVDRHAASYARDGRVSFGPVLTESCAEALHAVLRGREDWRQVVNSGDRVVELDRPTRTAMAPDRAEALDEAVHAGARYGFQYRYETLRVPDAEEERAASDDPLAAFASWWSQGEPRALLRRIVGDETIAFADAQATAYSPGDFLTAHDDAVAGKGRIAAYVLGLTPTWRPEWGGLLLFHGGEDEEIRSIAPGLNRLNLFRVPQVHSVSAVTRAAAYRRYSITGWLRG